MSELGFWPRFVLSVLATWRATYFLVHEDGPGDIVVRARRHLGDGLVGRMLDCFYCVSFWVAAPFAIFVADLPLDRLVAWVALSGAACLLERIGGQPLVIQPLRDESQGVDDDAMLRTAESRVEKDGISRTSNGSAALR